MTAARLDLRRMQGISGQENGAVSEDCAAPHENPKLTHINQTAVTELRSIGYAESSQAGKGLHKSSMLNMTNKTTQAIMSLQIHDNEWQTAEGNEA